MPEVSSGLDVFEWFEPQTDRRHSHVCDQEPQDMTPPGSRAAMTLLNQLDSALAVKWVPSKRGKTHASLVTAPDQKGLQLPDWAALHSPWAAFGEIQAVSGESCNVTRGKESATLRAQAEIKPQARPPGSCYRGWLRIGKIDNAP